MKRYFSLFLFLALVMMLGSATRADEAQTTPAVPTSGFRAELLGQIDQLGKKLVDLAEAMPAEKYSWRPAEGVRSVGEVYAHVAGANFMIPKFVGVEPPAGSSYDMDKKITEKDKILESLKQSIEHVRQVVLNTSDADLDNPADFFGEKTTVRNVLMSLVMHQHEHLGQSIAYARMNGVVPPWSAKGQ